MADKELLEALKGALDFEHKGEGIYREVAEKSEDTFIKTLFTGLAEDEIEHARVIEGFAQSLEQDGFFDINNELSHIKDNNPQRIFGENIDRFRQTAGAAKEDMEAFDIGIDLENKSIKYYNEAKEKAETDEAKDFFDFLIRQETMHRDSLQKAKAFLEDPEHGFNELEGWLLDGA